MLSKYFNSSKLLTLLILLIIVISGFWFRLKGISTNHSFWSDETFISFMAKDVLDGKRTIGESVIISGVNYQPLNFLLTTLSFYLLGLSEFSARFPSVVISTIGIIFIFSLTNKFSNPAGGLLASFLYSLSQLILANSTQAKPYSSIGVLIIIVIYLITLLKKEKTRIQALIHILIILFSTMAALMNFIGIIVWIPYLMYILLTYKNKILFSFHQPKHILIVILLFTLGFLLFQIPTMLYLFISSDVYNNTTYLRELLWKNYAFIVLPAIFGFLITFSKHKYLLTGLTLLIITLLTLWNFRQYSHNIRYLVPLFGLIFVFFGVFWSKVGEKLFVNRSYIVCFLVAISLFLGGDKIMRFPKNYYNPNKDLYGDVQIANYKDTFKILLKRFPNINDYVIYNDLSDPQIWYLNGRYPDATFVKYYALGIEYNDKTVNGITKKPIYTSLDQFKKELNRNAKGILIIENWESLLPEEIKKYAKTNLKFEYEVDSLPEAKEDRWPLEVYSWGMD